MPHQPDATTESGVYYVVPNRNGKGKRLIRKPRPPLTSAPLPDDFDAATQDCTTLRGPSHSMTTLGGSTSHSPTHSRRAHGGNNSAIISERNHRLDLRGYDKEYNRYVNDIEHMFGRKKPVEVSVRTLEQGKSRLWYKPSPSHDNQQRHEYEVVKNRVLEDSPEKTVTISTWRERVAEETSREVEMSVYYVNAEDYIEAISEAESQARRHLPQSPPRNGRQTPWPRKDRSPVRFPVKQNGHVSNNSAHYTSSSTTTPRVNTSQLNNGHQNGDQSSLHSKRGVSPVPSATRDWWNGPHRSTPVKRHSSATSSLIPSPRAMSIDKASNTSLRAILSS